MGKELKIFNCSVFLQTQIFILPVLLLFYQHCGLTVGDFFLFQGIFSFVTLLLGVPCGYIGDIFPRRNVIMFSYFLFICRLLLWLFFSQYGYWVILAGEVLYAAQKAFFAGSSDSYMYEFLKKNKIADKMIEKYGKYNFFMSFGTAIASLFGAYIYNKVSNWTILNYNADYGFIVLLVIELLFNTTAFLMLFFLPNIKTEIQENRTKRENCLPIIKSIINVMKNKSLLNYISLSGIFAGTATFLAWSFQPIMKLLGVPVVFFGVVYFVNHLLRGASAFYVNKIIMKINLAKLAVITFILFIISYLMIITITGMQSIPYLLTVLILIFCCFTIGCQIAYTIANISRIHKIIGSESRASISSINTAFARFWNGIMFILFNYILSVWSYKYSFIVCLLIFMVALLPLVGIISENKDVSYENK